ncbi:MAG: PAS domain S-box protein [Planctomycetota bacterium]
MNPDSSDRPERHAYLEEIFATAVDAIVVIDERGIVQDANPALERLFGFSVEEVLGQNVSLLMPSPDRERHDGYLANYLRTASAKIIGIGREVVGQRKDRSTFPMHLAVSEIVSDRKRLFVGVVRDISDLKQAEGQLRELNEQLEDRVQSRTEELRATQAELVRSEKLATLGQVSGGIAHEIRNPLNVVKTSAYFLCNAKSPTPEKVREHLSRIDRQVTLIDSVITALSDVARLPDPQPVPCEIDEMIVGIIGSIQLGDDIQFDGGFPAKLPAVWGDPNQLPIVFRNLIRNARDAMPDGGTLSVSAERDDNALAIRVTDTGVGIAADQMTKIMEPLYSTKARGMGLGLAISIAILQRNGGSLGVESTVDVGSTFTVTLPISSDQNLGRPS